MVLSLILTSCFQDQATMLSYYYDLDGACRNLNWGENYAADDEMESENGEEESTLSFEEEAEEMNEEDIEGEIRPVLIMWTMKQTCHHPFHL